MSDASLLRLLHSLHSQNWMSEERLVCISIISIMDTERSNLKMATLTLYFCVILRVKNCHNKLQKSDYTYVDYAMNIFKIFIKINNSPLTTSFKSMMSF